MKTIYLIPIIRKISKPAKGQVRINIISLHLTDASERDNGIIALLTLISVPFRNPWIPFSYFYPKSGIQNRFLFFFNPFSFHHSVLIVLCLKILDAFFAATVP